MASTIKVDNVQNQPGTNIINKCSTTVTLGASGDTVALAAGASQTGFGQTYSAVSWDTTPKTGTVTAATGIGYFVNTTGGGITVNLPTGSAGLIVAVADYNGLAATNNITVGRGGSNINGAASDFVINTNFASITFVYVDATSGWRSVSTSRTADAYEHSFITATVSGACNTLTTVCTNYKLAKFTGPGSFKVSTAGNTCGSNTVDYMVVAAGGGGGSAHGGGGGAGGFRESPGTASGCYAVSPLGVAPAAALPVTVADYSVQIGAGGAGGPTTTSGTPSIFSTITSTGGGRGGFMGPTTDSGGEPGGSGSGTAGWPSNPAGTGNTPPVSPPQGTDGGLTGTGYPAGYAAAGGGGATVAGAPGLATAGGAGATTSISSAPASYSGGGGGASPNTGSPSGGAGGLGGGGAGGTAAPFPATPGTINTGGGGGGLNSGSGFGAGGSGIIYIRYKFQ